MKFFKKTKLRLSFAASLLTIVAVAGLVSADTIGELIPGGLDVFGGKVRMTTAASPPSPSGSVVHIHNEGDQALGLHVGSRWTGSKASPYQNRDSILSTVNNTVQDDSLNRSWAGSFANAYNSIPKGVTDSGERVGVIGWAVSVTQPGYLHEGTLREQVGIKGRSGFQGSGEYTSAETAVIDKAIGVRGEIVHDSPGATIQKARAGEFISAPNVHNVDNNVAVYALALYGRETNYSFYSPFGELFNAGRSSFGNLIGQSDASISARKAGNSMEFGHVDTRGYGSSIGATYANGLPFVAFNGEADASGNTFRTRGKPGVIVSSDLAGSLVFSRVPFVNTAGQKPIENGRFDGRGQFVLRKPPILPSRTPESRTAPCRTGEMTWDKNFTYVCVAANTWKRSVLSDW